VSISLRSFAIEVVQQLNRAGYTAYWAGGCVRDLLLGIDPADFDIATSATPDQIRRTFGFGRTLPVGAAFGVIIVLSPDRQTQVEVATFRTDSGYSDGRRPDSVFFSTPEMDAQRRDFTINGMFYDPVNQRVIDYVGGQQDLQHSILRAIGDPHARIREDKLRMLRAVRIAARYGFEIQDETYRAIQRHALETSSVSGERLAVELRKTLETRAASWAVAAWADTQLLQVLIPEVAAVWAESDRSERILKMLGHPGPADWLARLGGMLWAAMEPPFTDSLDALKCRLRFSNSDAAALSFALAHQESLAAADSLPWSAIQPLLISPWIETATRLLELRTELGEVAPATSQWIRGRLAWSEQRLNPPRILTGQDLLEAGLRSGPQFRQLLDEARCRQLDGHLSDRDQALQWLGEKRTS
jgi:poly(A) polymerase